jgi:hypothetical protein
VCLGGKQTIRISEIKDEKCEIYLSLCATVFTASVCSHDGLCGRDGRSARAELSTHITKKREYRSGQATIPFPYNPTTPHTTIKMGDSIIRGVQIEALVCLSKATFCYKSDMRLRR